MGEITKWGFGCILYLGYHKAKIKVLAKRAPYQKALRRMASEFMWVIGRS